MIKVHDKFFQPFISEEQIRNRVVEIGHSIGVAYALKQPVFVGILNGSCIFLADLIRVCQIECQITFARISSYKGTVSSGTLNTIFGLDKEHIANRHVIIVEDIIDSGLTISGFLPQVLALKPASVAVVTLLLKPTALKCTLQVDYIGFEIPEKFVIGYGLDYDGLGRNLSSIFQLKED